MIDMIIGGDMGFDEILLLTGERTRQAGFPFVLENVRLAAARFNAVTIETFPMAVDEYKALADAGVRVILAPAT